jgi:hypothetical protein
MTNLKVRAGAPAVPLTCSPGGASGGSAGGWIWR